MTRSKRVAKRRLFLEGQLGFRQISQPKAGSWKLLITRLARAEVRIEELEEVMATVVQRLDEENHS